MAGDVSRVAQSSAGSLLSDARPPTPRSILHGLFEHRSKFADVEIRCSDGKVLFAHKALLAVREQFFKERFFVKKDGREERVGRASIAIFREESTILVPILEFLYTGVIASLRDAPERLPDAEGRLWLRFLTWCARNEIKSVSRYVHDILMGHTLTTTCAAEVLAVLAAADFAEVANTKMESESGALRIKQSSELKALALHSYQVAEFTDSLFMPLTREALKLLLCSTDFHASGVDVCRAVAKWAADSEWVKSNVYGGVLTAEHLVDVTCLLHPWSLTAKEFEQVSSLFTPSIRTEVWRSLATGRLSSELASLSRKVSNSESQMNLRELSRSRLNQSLHQLHKEASTAMERIRPQKSMRSSTSSRAVSAAASSLARSMDALESEIATRARVQRAMHSSVIERPSTTLSATTSAASRAEAGDCLPPLPPASQSDLPTAGHALGEDTPQNRSFKRVLTRIESIAGKGTTGNLPPLMPSNEQGQGPSQVRRSQSLAARSDPFDPITAYQFGVRLQLLAESEFVALISSDTTHHQSVVYKVGVTTGTLRWSIEVVRPCDMLWMGVTAEFDIDTSQWAARYSNVWMASEECSCLAHLAEFTKLHRDEPGRQHDMHPAHVGLTRLPCTRCLTLPDDDRNDQWSYVVAELNADTGELWMDVNKTGMQLVFHSLPTDRPLYPVVSVTNASQIRFTHMQAGEEYATGTGLL